ncbi:MAG: hypothetical protein ABIV47_06250 [Roseiflexaceae bacterium]
MGVWKTISNALYKEYDRRIRRASLITEYGAAHHGSHDPHADSMHDDADIEEAEITNIPRGTPVAAAEEHAADTSGVV